MYDAYYLAANPNVQRKLQAELDEALGSARTAPPDIEASETAPLPPWASVAQYADIKALPYLQACIQERTKMHGALGAGLPRIIPKGSTLEVYGENLLKERSSACRRIAFTTMSSEVQIPRH
ncbi:hypothetical protein FRC08_018728 [Ceratobasidium sp. 394]|nr:hypothetical protein FRC08_018728 [Ceratobasidium sp. 394]KAG9093621.1 hypothetical protein FS749_014081 [Ceratobasidium sp. UAMH 11750]